MKANHSSSEGKKGLMDTLVSFIAHPQAVRLVQPTHQSLDRPAMFSKPAAMGRAPLGQHWLNASLVEAVAVRLRVIASVALHLFGAAARTASFALHRWNRIHQRLQLLDVRHISMSGTLAAVVC